MKTIPHTFGSRQRSNQRIDYAVSFISHRLRGQEQFAFRGSWLASNLFTLRGQTVAFTGSSMGGTAACGRGRVGLVCAVLLVWLAQFSIGRRVILTRAPKARHDGSKPQFRTVAAEM